MLQEAIQNEQAISFSYRKPRETTKIERTVHPYGLVNISGIWYIVAHCLLRKQIRNFRLDRMDTLQQKQEFLQNRKTFLYKTINLKTIVLLRFIYCFQLILHIKLLNPDTFYRFIRA